MERVKLRRINYDLPNQIFEEASKRPLETEMDHLVADRASLRVCDMESRRDFIKRIATVVGMVTVGREALTQLVHAKPMSLENRSTVYRSVNGKPDENLTKVIDLMGGIEKIIGADDVVVLKPNVQWWNQGAPNLAALDAFVDLIMHRSGGFKGEVILGENCHRGSQPWTSAGWVNRFERNADLPGIGSFNGLGERLKTRHGKRFSTCHWIDVKAGGKRVFSPEEGSGYVYCDGGGGVPLISLDNGCAGANKRFVIMTYPIFTTDKGTIVDFKSGVWEKGAYTGQPLKFINLAALNHHSIYCGMTSAIKNYLGVTDLSGGPDPQNGGKLTERYYNFHSFPFNKWAPGPMPGMIGAEIAHSMNTIRKADLNIVTAEWVGLSSRTDPPVARTRALLASTNPVALDYHSAKYLLYSNSELRIHDPDDAKSPLHQYLAKCAEQGGGSGDERYVKVTSYDFLTKKLQGDEDLVVHAERQWGSNPKAIMKYLYLRYNPRS
jgi:hypothetical protein